ncbi:PTS sugar transporter subunit IIA [Enterococcus sp. CWB-B31]|uniref:PTS sugar transporter subunit IIA n=1 Tax=Enterococcus sp. CWB-B31 TaxID=2885159 RepID=UPI001E4AEAC9|nr:PTS fructose transporter subunit IIA [Enterococcus sp. CWB-B31]MCB5954040.1 PTS fructose transporter subunit IIA [Enterococcus sp. CWB-B31]
MKPKLILMSHGKMAYETYQSAKMIVGELADIAAVSMQEQDGMAGTQEKLTALLNEAGDAPVLVIADLKGGTPCNVAMMAMGMKENMRVISGLNLAMVLEAVLSPVEELDMLVSSLLSVGKEAVTMIELPTLDEDEYEE